MNFYAQNARKEKVVNTAESESLGREKRDCPARKEEDDFGFGSLGGEIVC